MRHVIILGDLLDQSVNEVRQILLDWHLCGLVQRPYWLSLDEGDRFIETLTADGTERAVLSEWLDKHIEVNDQLELVSLQMHNDSGLYVHASQIAKSIAGFDPLIKAEAKIINLIAPADKDGSVPAEVLMNYRTNLVAIPTQSSSSRSGHITLRPFTSGFFANVASAVATASGIWSGQANNPLRDLPYPKSRRPEVMMFRSFVRYADASDLVAEVVQDVVKRAGANGLPLSYNERGDRLSPLNYHNAKSDVEQVALSFIEANKSAFDLRKFKDQPTPKIIAVTPMGLMREYWKYIKKSLRISERIVERKNEAASAAAIAFQKVFLGDDSTMQVFVSGVSGAPTRKADNSLNAVLDLVNAAHSLRKTVVQPQAANPRQLWKDFTATATALIDGGTGPNGVELPRVAGGDRRLVAYPELVVPEHRSIPFQVPANLDLPLRGEIISADNPYLTAVLRDQIDRALKHSENMEPVQIGQLQRTKFELDLWIDTKKSFSWFIGMKLGQRINEARNFLGGLNFEDKIDEKTRLEALAKAEAKVKKSVDRILGGLFTILFGGTLLGVVSSFWTFLATAVWPVFSLGGLLLPGAIIAGLMTIWNVWGFRSFASAVRDVFKLTYANDMNKAKVEWAEEIKDDLANEIKRLGDLYQQYQLWSEVITKPIHDPLGTPEVFANNDGRIKNLNQITSSIQLAELNHEGEALENLVDHVKKKFFSMGWLDRILTRRLETLGATFPATWLDSGTDDSSPLHRILDRTRRSDGRREIGQIVVEELQEMTTADTDYSVWPLSILNMPIERKVQCHEFMAPLATGSSVMPNALLSDFADVNAASKIDNLRSFVLADSRVGLHSDVPKYLVDPSIVEIERRLDIINLRVELTRALHAEAITTFAPAVVEIQLDEDLTVAPEA